MVMISRAMWLFFLFWLLFRLVFFGFGFGTPDGIHRPQRAEPALAQRPLALQLGLGLDRKARPGDRLQARLWDRLAGQFTNSVGVSFNALERLFDLVNGVLVRGQKAEREIAVEVIRAGIGHVEAVTGHFLGGFLR